MDTRQPGGEDLSAATKSEFAYHQVRARILSGDLRPGSTLNQATLARSIGISTTPLREALRRLKSEGLVELGAHRDARVTDLSAEEARDLLELRRSLDPLAAGLAADRRTTADIRTMRQALREVEPLAGRVRVEDLVAHRRFHAAVYAASHNELLIATLDGLWDKSDRYRRLELEDRGPGERHTERAAEHAALLESVAAGDAEGAASLMRQHIAASLGARALMRLREAAGTAVNPG